MARNAKGAKASEATGSDEKAVEAAVAAAADAAKVSGGDVSVVTGATPAAAEPSGSDAAALEAAVAADIANMDAGDVADLREALTEVVAMVAVVTAPHGPRRRAGHAFGPQPVRLPLDVLSHDELAAITTDPLLKVTFEGMDEDEIAQAVE